MELNKFAFDIDGTIVDDHFKLHKGVVEYFYRILNECKNPEFMFCTGTNFVKAKKAIGMIEKELKEKFAFQEDLNYKVATFGGSVIYNEAGKILHKEHIDIDSFDKIKKVVTEIDDKAILLINTRNGMFYLEPKTISVDNAKIQVLRLLQAIKGEGGFKTEPKSFRNFYKTLNNELVYSLEILSLSSTKNKKITTALMENIDNLKISAGTTIQVSNGGKLEAIKNYFENDTKKVVYVGDGYNDIEPMKACALSFALGKKVKVLKSATYALEKFEDITGIVFDGTDYDETSKRVIEKAIEAEEKKKERKEKGRIKVAIESVKSKLSKDNSFEK